jgi:tetratricopeptide (TPR) repeat protein
MVTETKIRDFQKSQPLPSFRLNAPTTNPFVPRLPTSVTGDVPTLKFTWKTDAGQGRANAPDHARALLDLVERLRRETVRFPKSAAVRVNLAIALSNQGSLDEAEQELLAALELENGSYLVKVNLAHLLARRGRFDEAVSLYDDLLADRPSDNTILLSLAVMSLRQGDFAGAEDRLKQACANRDDDATAHFLLGMVKLCMNNLRGAISELRAAARIDVRNPAIHQALGVVFALRSEFDRAELEFRAALAFVPNDRSSLRALYQVLLNQGKSGEAVEVLNSFIERNPGDVAAREALALGLLGLKRFGSARFHLSRLLSESDTLPVEQAARIHANLGLSWLLEGRIEDARTAFVKAIDIYPNVSPIVYENLARLLLDQENYEAAIGILRRSKLIFPDSAGTVVLLSHAYSLVDEEEQGIQELEAFLVHHQATVEIYVHLGFLYSRIGGLQRSMEVSREGAKRSPHSVMILNNLAYVYAMMDELDEARATLRMAPKDFVPHAEWIATKGLLLLRGGDEKAGVALYEEAERLAAQLGNKELGRRVRQKKYLELARFWMRKNAIDKAHLEIKRGLDIKVKHFSYERDLRQLAADLRGLKVID